MTILFEYKWKIIKSLDNLINCHCLYMLDILFIKEKSNTIAIY